MEILKYAMMVVAALSVVSLMTTAADASCARWGETGYHYYRSCAGPSFLYPHHRRCDRNGICIYH